MDQSEVLKEFDEWSALNPPKKTDVPELRKKLDDLARLQARIDALKAGIVEAKDELNRNRRKKP